MKIKLNESKKLEFDVDTVGCSWNDLKGHLRFVLEDIEYGFPAKFENGAVSVEIPAFQDIIGNKVKEYVSSDKQLIMNGRLDIIANESTYLTPWTGYVEVEIPVSVKVKNNEVMKDIMEAAKDIKVDNPKITTTSTSEENPEPFDKVLKIAKQEADKKAKEYARQEKRKEKTKLGSVLMGSK